MVSPDQHSDRHKLLHGPYQAPAFQRGDRATCLYRDVEVVITSWTDAPIPWPRWRARRVDACIECIIGTAGVAPGWPALHAADLTPCG